jgi:hypothetical protein
MEFEKEQQSLRLIPIKTERTEKLSSNGQFETPKSEVSSPQKE